jgi:GT2 family glycosyltransferase
MDNSNKNNKLKLSIIIVNYNGEEILEDCIRSIYESSKSNNYEIIVVDNASVDNSRERICSKYSDIYWIQNSENRGFAAGNNQGIRQASGEYIMLLNNDTIVLNGALEKLVEYLDNHSEAGAVGPRILNTDHTLQSSCRRGLPNAVNSFGYFTKLYKVFPKSKSLGSYTMSYISDKIDHEVEVLSGAAMVVRKSVVDKIGGLDEGFFMHFEDVDWCYNIGKCGYKLYYIHSSEIIHLKGQSSKLRSRNVIEDFHNSLMYYYKKNFAAQKSPLTNSAVYSFISLRKLMSVVLYNYKKIRR